MPNLAVWSASHASAAARRASVAALVLAALNLGFAIYIAHIASYNAIYGALAGIPILLLWMYIFWGAVLLGAELAAHLADGGGGP